ncbi:MAG: GDSL-type esterase/lipase family protein [Myxococcota bacterium]
MSDGERTRAGRGASAVSLGARIGFAALFASVLGVVWLAVRGADELHRFRSDDPTVWEADIAAFERAAAAHPPPRDAVLVVGASTVRFWETAAEDLAPLSVVCRGFGGAKVGDVAHYAERLVRPAPRALVVSIGGNDLFDLAGSEPRSADEVAVSLEVLLARLRALVAPAPVYFVSIRPPILDPQGRDPSSQVNARVRAFAQATEGVEYVDANRDLYATSGHLREGMRSWDRSQLSREGYRAWSAPIRERLVRDLGLGRDRAAPADPDDPDDPDAPRADDVPRADDAPRASEAG